MASSTKRAAAKSVSDVDSPQVRPEDTALVSNALVLFGYPLNNKLLLLILAGQVWSTRPLS